MLKRISYVESQNFDLREIFKTKIETEVKGENYELE